MAKKKPTEVLTADSLTNVVSGLGTQRDKAASTHYTFCQMGSDELIAAYRGAWLPRAIVDMPAEDAVRKWREWRADPEQITKIEALEAKLGLANKVEQALKMARLLGGCAIYISTNEKTPEKPLDPRRVTDIRALTLLTQADLKAGDVVKDIESPYYGKPEFYKLGENTIIHASRLIILEGQQLPLGAVSYGYRDSPLSGYNNNCQWGDSVLQSVMDAVMAHDSSAANIVSLIFEAKVNVFKFEGLSEQLKVNKGQNVLNRMVLQTTMKGINGDVVIDAKDEFEQRNASFGGLDSLLERFGYIVAGAAEIPATRLFGRSSAGLSGSGDGDERVYFDRVNHEQTSKIEPALRLFDQCLLKVALGSIPPEIWYEWRPLRQMSEVERADIFHKYAQAARSLAGSQDGAIVPLEALSESTVNGLIELGVLPGLEDAVKEYGNLGEGEDDETIEEDS